MKPLTPDLSSGLDLGVVGSSPYETYSFKTCVYIHFHLGAFLGCP